jgi:RNA polymerase sigma-70 factor, ECF subfamily
VICHPPSVAEGPAQGRWRQERPAFSAVFVDHVEAVFRFHAYRAPSRETAEDLTQVTFEKALKAWPRFDPARAMPRTWLLAIARNVLIDERRADRHELTLDDARLDLLTTHDEHRLGPSAALSTALAGLATREREVLGLRFGADLSGPEIADVMGLSVGNVQQILSRTLRRLRADLTDLDEGEREG